MLEDLSSFMMHRGSEQDAHEAPTMTDFNKAQSGEFFCQQAVEQTGQSGTEFSRNKIAQ